MQEHRLAELSLLGALLIDKKLMEAEVVRDPKIFSAQGQTLFKAISDCYEHHKAVDVVLVLEFIKEENLEKCNLLIAEAMNTCPMSSNARRYADVLERNSIRAETIERAGTLQEAIREGDAPARIREHLESIDELLGSTDDPEHLNEFNIQEILDEEEEPVPWVLKDWLASRDVCVLAGEQGTGKSIFALDLAISLASGTEFLSSMQTGDQQRVLYIDEEMNPRLAKRRLRQLYTGRQLDPDLVELRYLNGNQINFDRPESRMVLRKLFGEWVPHWVVCDSLIRIHSRDENSNSEMSQFFKGVLRPMQDEFDFGWIGLHHLGKPSKDKSQEFAHRVRGASDLPAFVDMLWGLEGDTSTNVRTLSQIKNRWRSQPAPPMTMFYSESEDETWSRLKGEERTVHAEDTIMGLLEGAKEEGRARSVIIEALTVAYTAKSAKTIANNTLGKLEHQGSIVRKKTGRVTHCWHKDYVPQKVMKYLKDQEEKNDDD